MKKTAAIVLSGGQGARLFPLTVSRCKPAMYYGGRHRLIDIPVSNAINSGCSDIFVITQFLSRSLHQHLINTYQANSFSSSRIHLLTVEERHNEKKWLQGTADAVRQNILYLQETSAEYFLVLSGDQIYTMDYNGMLKVARDTNADVVIAALPVPKESTNRLGIMQIDKNNIITSFIEKPQVSSELTTMKLSPAQKKQLQIVNKDKCHYLGSMGIYLFKRDVLIDWLKKDIRDDFGKHIIPSKVKDGKVAGYIHNGYWEDVGTIQSFYNANMALNSDSPPFNSADEEWPFFASSTMLPGASFVNSRIDQSIVCEGSFIDTSTVSHSILGPSTRVQKGTFIDHSYLMGNNFRHSSLRNSYKKCQIGENCLIKKALIDRNVTIGNGVKLINQKNLTHYDSDHAYIRDGIIVIPRGAILPDNFIL